MKTLFSTLIAIAITGIAIAQNPDKALARVRYSFSHLRDTTKKEDLTKENMLLVIGKNASVYTSYDKLNRDLDMQKQVAEQIKNQGGGGGPMSISIKRTESSATTQNDIFFFANENKLISKERLFNNYLMEEDAPKINWKISKDTMSFSGVKCQKATSYFKGRNWIAWFAPELPFQSGPWKLNGLPGLIIQAYDEKKEVQFLFAGIDNVTEADAKVSDPNLGIPAGPGGSIKIMGMDVGSAYLGSEIKLPTDAIKTTRKEFEKLKEARDKDPQGFMNAQMAASGVNFGGGKMSFKGSSNGSMLLKESMNNPIELPEKK